MSTEYNYIQALKELRLVGAVELGHLANRY